ncbi:hypothetical protein [uncultured Nostoc sp.]|uniref:hypothetical protein n=1 Tax=uncultured Nostoc sp. TaxID=340711 RepID=UPI0035CB877A
MLAIGDCADKLITTGTLMVAIVEEILPEADQTQDTNLSTLTFIGSFAFSIYFE